MDDRQKALDSLLAKRYTHSCPDCNKPSYCTIEAGKSAGLCWCMQVEAKSSNQGRGWDVCLCKECL